MKFYRLSAFARELELDTWRTLGGADYWADTGLQLPMPPLGV